MSEPSKEAQEAAAAFWQGVRYHAEIGVIEAFARGYDAATAKLREELDDYKDKYWKLSNVAAGLREENEHQGKTLDWAETLLCNVVPMPHCTQEEWDAILKKWRDEKHELSPGEPAQPKTEGTRT